LDCVPPVATGKAKILLRDSTLVDKKLVSWTWKAGALIPVEDFGDPTTVDSYALCIYAADASLLTAVVPGGGTCGSRACWKSNPRGFKYINKLGTPGGVIKLALRSGDVGSAKITAKGKGAGLAMPSLENLPLPVRVQLQANRCWEAVYSTPTIDNAAIFKASSD